MKIRNQRDFGAGIMYMVIGLFFTLVATHYPMGTAAKMGPGYFPFFLGILMTLLGLLVLVKSLRATAAIESIPKFNWRIIGLPGEISEMVLKTLAKTVHCVWLSNSKPGATHASSIWDGGNSAGVVPPTLG